MILVVNSIDSLTHLSGMTNLDQLPKLVSNCRVVALLGICFGADTVRSWLEAFLHARYLMN